ncbi:MAG: LysM peptidoglycan-binding domain-containing protein [Treponema sp.]|nr:LysM peptidoglycan-binding domain-containing protein [Treponema sp.]
MKIQKRRLPKFIDINTFDFTPYGRELTREESYRVNGGNVNEDVHTVQSGDTLGTLVYNYNQEHGTNLTVNEVAANNGIDNPDLIYVGQTINFGNPGNNQEKPQTDTSSDNSTPDITPQQPNQSLIPTSIYTNSGNNGNYKPSYSTSSDCYNPESSDPCNNSSSNYNDREYPSSKDGLINTNNKRNAGSGKAVNSINKIYVSSLGYEIDYYNKIIRSPRNNQKALLEASEKFLAFEREELGYTFEVLCENSESIKFLKYSEIVSFMGELQPDVDFFIGIDNSCKTANQNKVDKEVFLEIHKKNNNNSGYNGINVQGGLLRLSSELNNSKMTNNIAGSFSLDVMDGEYNIETGKGLKASVGLNISTVSGEIGIQGDDWKFTVGGALGLGVSGGFDINVPEKRLALDLTAVYGISFVIDLPDSGF